MREKGVHIWDGFPCFIIETHNQEDLEFVVQKFEESVLELLSHDFIRSEKIPDLKIPKVPESSFDIAPIPGALLGKDRDGNPAWFLPDDNIPGKYFQLTF